MSAGAQSGTCAGLTPRSLRLILNAPCRSRLRLKLCRGDRARPIPLLRPSTASAADKQAKPMGHSKLLVSRCIIDCWFWSTLLLSPDAHPFKLQLAGRKQRTEGDQSRLFDWKTSSVNVFSGQCPTTDANGMVLMTSGARPEHAYQYNPSHYSLSITAAKKNRPLKRVTRFKAWFKSHHSINVP